MESGDFEEYLATPEITSEMKKFTEFIKKEKKIDGSKREGYKAVMLVGIRSAYDQVESLKKQQLITQENDALIFKSTAYHSFISALLQPPLAPSLSHVATLNDWDSCFVYGIGIVLGASRMTTEETEPSILIEEFRKNNPDRAELCSFFQSFLGENFLYNSDSCIAE
jgi:hypothetical protein